MSRAMEQPVSFDLDTAQRRLLDWQVIEGTDAWIANAREVLGDVDARAALDAKLTAIRFADFLSASDQRSAAEREAAERAELQALHKAAEEAEAAARTQRAGELQAALQQAIATGDAAALAALLAGGGG